jgi:hypothetical protein
MTANGRDQAVLEFLKLETRELDFRPGLVDVTELNRRWGKRIKPLHNGRRIDERPLDGKTENENLNRFTWVMTMMTVCLDVSLTNSSLQTVMLTFLAHLFEGRVIPNIADYLQHEIAEHIKGWRSTATVRGMFEKVQGNRPPNSDGFVTVFDSRFP